MSLIFFKKLGPAVYCYFSLIVYKPFFFHLSLTNRCFCFVFGKNRCFVIKKIFISF